jgi:uncharacterized protein YyaL (SSP411 family)
MKPLKILKSPPSITRWFISIKFDRDERPDIDQIYMGWLVLLADDAENQAYLAGKLLFMKTAVRLDNKATAYVCTDSTCKMPVTDPKALQLQLEGNKTGR